MKSETRNRNPLKKAGSMVLALMLTASVLASCGKSVPGAQGEKGADGKSAYQIAIDAGFTGTYGEWLQSLKGEKGDKGDTGAQGEKGDTGAQGAKGDKGEKGDKGDTGAQGEKGEQGNTGATGEKGEKGDTGAQGEKGEQGEKGDKGDPGAPGVKGDKGDTGKSAYEAYCEIYGYEGSEEEWLADLVSGKLVSYRVRFDLNGGIAPEGFSETVLLTAGSLIPLTEPSREGYTFLGWYTGEGINDGKVTTTTPVQSELNLIARWRLNSYTVKFVGPDGKTLKIETVPYGGAATAPATLPKVDKMRFDSWDVPFDCVTDKLTVTAQYVWDCYTVTFLLDDGTVFEKIDFYMGEGIRRPKNDPVKEGYYFLGWYSDPIEGDFEFPFVPALNVDTTLYARFSEKLPISTAAQLRSISTNQRYYLTCDIDLEGESWSPIWYFDGELDGQGHKIFNFTMSDGSYFSGFFASINHGGVVKNVTFADFSMTVNTAEAFSAGVIAGSNSGTIENCIVEDAIISYSYSKKYNASTTSTISLGGCVGHNTGVISNCIANIDIICLINIANTAGGYSPSQFTNWNNIGGIAGTNNGSLVKNHSANIISVSGTVDGAQAQNFYYCASVSRIGGTVGHNFGSVSACTGKDSISYSFNQYSKVKIIDIHAGGLVGVNEGNIENCVALGQISDSTSNTVSKIYIGGFVGHSLSGSIKNCYAQSTLNQNVSVRGIDEERIGGFVGYNQATISNCYANSTVKTQISTGVGGFAGRNATGGSISKCLAFGSLETVTNSNVGYFVGVEESGSSLFKCYYDSAMTVTYAYGLNDSGTAATAETLISQEFLTDKLSWSKDIWTFADSKKPTLNFENE